MTFSTNFYPNIWVIANLIIYRKSIHDNISIVYPGQKNFCLALFWRRYKTVCTYKHLHKKIWLVLLWTSYELFLVINIGIITSASVILKKLKFIVIPIYFHWCNIPTRYSSSTSKISDCVNIIGITVTQHYTGKAYNRVTEQKTKERKQRVQKLRRFGVETT